MYILMIARGYPTKKYKMNGIFEFDQAKALAAAGHKVVYAAVDVRSIRRWRKWGIEKKTIEGVRIYAVNLPGGRIPKTILQKMSILGLYILYRIIVNEQGKPDIMHAHFASIGYTASRLKKKTNIPLIITEHLSTMMKPEIDRRLFETAKQAYDNADILITVSPALKNVINKRFNRNAIHIPNIVDTELFSVSSIKKDNIFRFVSVGGLKTIKRMHLTIEAFINAFKDNERVTLTIFGEGPERASLENLIRKHNVSDKVRLMGLQSREDISKYLKESDCFVLASQAETFGVAYIEALASGVPVIATKCGGPESFVSDKNGIIIPVDDMDALVEAMKYMYYNANRYNRELIAEEASKKFSPNAIASKLYQVYKEAVINGGKRIERSYNKEL